jgi:hypothetical protein
MSTLLSGKHRNVGNGEMKTFGFEILSDCLHLFLHHMIHVIGNHPFLLYKHFTKICKYLSAAENSIQTNL